MMDDNISYITVHSDHEWWRFHNASFRLDAIECVWDNDILSTAKKDVYHVKLWRDLKVVQVYSFMGRHAMLLKKQ